jgi:predicted P-loop ATPase
VDIPGLAAARDQLWAEGVARFRAGGIAWQVAEELARAEHHKFEVVDELLSVVQAWLDQVPPFKLGEPIATEPRSAGVVRGVDILTGALNTPFSQIKKNDEMRLAKIMRRLNYERGYLWENDRNIRVWKKLHKII